MNILILGSGGREHAIAWKISQSKLCSHIYIAPGNAGTLNCGINVNININNFEDIAEFVLANKINLVIPGPETPLVAGIYDFFKSKPELKDIHILGPSAKGAMLEGSKDFAKQFMHRYNIPTAKYFSANSSNYNEACKFLSSLKPPYVLKADGLAAGKGVIIIDNLLEAQATLKEMLNGMFGIASKCVVIEEYLKGIELSVFILTDGEDFLILPQAKDYKRIGENNTGPNTGGMGSVSPVPFADSIFMQKVEQQIVRPTILGLKKENIDYKGFIFLGLMNVNGHPYVIEYNVRMGDPETESVMPRIKNDLLELIIECTKGNLKNYYIETDDRFAVSVMIVSGGYPDVYEKNKEICLPHTNDNVMFFHAGTITRDNKIFTNGGRVIAVTAYGETLNEAIRNAYAKVELVKFDNSYYRNDIGADL